MVLLVTNVACKFMNEDGEIYAAMVPAVRVVCERCNGTGVHDPAAFSQGFTSSEWNELDEDFKQDYFAGAYDVTCERCNGDRVRDVPNFDELTDQQKRDRQTYEDVQYYARREAADERRWGC